MTIQLLNLELMMKKIQVNMVGCNLFICFGNTSCRNDFERIECTLLAKIRWYKINNGRLLEVTESKKATFEYVAAILPTQAMIVPKVGSTKLCVIEFPDFL